MRESRDLVRIIVNLFNLINIKKLEIFYRWEKNKILLILQRNEYFNMRSVRG